MQCYQGMPNQSDASKKIIIIGAGISGCSALHDLYSHGFRNVELLEAKSSIGGRICTQNFGKFWNTFYHK